MNQGTVVTSGPANFAEIAHQNFLFSLCLITKAIQTVSLLSRSRMAAKRTLYGALRP